MKKILNLYCGIGGNRALWGNNYEVTAVEFDPEIAKVYKNRFLNDIVIVGDANAYLEEHFKEFDFIWASPPCQTHGQYRHNVGVLGKGFKPKLPDMSLYSQIIFLKTYYTGKFVVENVKPYYEPLIKPSVILQRHLFWSNFDIPELEVGKSDIRNKNKITDFADSTYVINSNIENKRQVLRNCVDSTVGKHILDASGV